MVANKRDAFALSEDGIGDQDLNLNFFYFFPTLNLWKLVYVELINHQINLRQIRSNSWIQTFNAWRDDYSCWVDLVVWIRLVLADHDSEGE